MARGKRLKCRNCGERAPRQFDGRHLRLCDECIRNSIESWHDHDTPGRERRIQSTYGLEVDEHGWMFVNQGGVCAICHDQERSDRAHGIGLVVDHNHETGVVRGLLCSRCNIALGLLRDDPSWALNAMGYLVRNDGCSNEQWERLTKRFKKFGYTRNRRSSSS